MVADLLDVDGLSEDTVLVLLLQLTEHGSQQDVEGGQLNLQHRLLLLHLTGEHINSSVWTLTQSFNTCERDQMYQ